MVEELIRWGITQFFVAPGSRSTPLVTAVARNPYAQSVVHFDERGTAFAALGYARATGRPAVWITTSGTAIANGLPAIIEASVDAVPLLILTADRPPELRNTGANQTIHQPGIFGQYVRWAFDGPAPDCNIAPSMVLTTIDQAVHRSRTGPVHLNWMFREPLAPRDEGGGFDTYLSALKNWERSDQPYTTYAPIKKSVSTDTIVTVDKIVSGARRGLIIAGRMASPEKGLAVLKLAEKLGWPLFVDLGSQIGLGYQQHPCVITNFDALLNTSALHESADVILQFGKRCISKEVLAWISASACDHYIYVDDYPDRLDPVHQVTFRVEAESGAFCSQLSQVLKDENQSRETWIDNWRQQDDKIGERLDLFFKNKSELTEPLIARTLSQLLMNQQVLVVANSMPVRDIDVFALAPVKDVKVILNRGASGIDGTVATAVGASLGSQQPATLFIGDLSLLHDLNSLALLKSLAFPLVIVVINNDGGGIFSFLPISSYNDVFESHFAVPHGLNFKASAGMFGLAYEKPENIASFRAVYKAALQDKRSTIIEIQTDREKNLAIHNAIKQYLIAE